jgi:hypothetical protein
MAALAENMVVAVPAATTAIIIAAAAVVISIGAGRRAITVPAA